MNIFRTADLPSPQLVTQEHVCISNASTGAQNVHWIKIPLNSGQYIYDFKLVSPVIHLSSSASRPERYSVQDSVDSVWLSVNGKTITSLLGSGGIVDDGYQMTTSIPLLGNNPLLVPYLYHSVLYLCIRFRELPRVDYLVEFTIGHLDRMRIRCAPNFDKLTHLVDDIANGTAVVYEHGTLSVT